MKKVMVVALLVVVLSGIMALAPSNSSSAQKFDKIVPGQYIVVLKDNIADVNVAATQMEAAFGLTKSHVYSHALKGFAATIPAARLEAVKSDPRVAFVEQDRIVQLVGTVPVVSGDTVPTGVRRMGSGTATTAQPSSGVNVAVIDTGINLTHPDLNAVNGKNCIRASKTAEDDNGHGSHVAGSIAAKNNGSGVVGVAPGTKLYAVKVLNAQGSGTFAQIVCGIDWVTANATALNIKVASMSLGGTGANDNNCGNTNGDSMHKAICNSVAAGITYVIAAGNESKDFATSVPASYPEVLTVSAMTDSDGMPGGVGAAPACRTTEKDDTYALFSNFAVKSSEINHTVAAPGTCIYSTWMRGGYNTISGTSMATPHVSGLVALCINAGGVAGPCSGLTPAQIIQKIRSDAQAAAAGNNGFVGDPLNPVSGKYFGYLVAGGAY